MCIVFTINIFEFSDVVREVISVRREIQRPVNPELNNFYFLRETRYML